MSGRYGAYVTDGETNATLPKGADPQTYAIDAAVELLKERAAMGGGKKKKKAKPSKAKVEKPAKAEKSATKEKTTKADKSAKVVKEKTGAPPKKSPAKKKVLEET
jgi:DNA topoisomerase-1